MSLTTAQKTTLKNYISNQPSLASQPMTADGAAAIADALNQAASPAFIVWRTKVSINEIGDKINGSELAGLSTLNTTRLQAVIMLSPAGYNPSLADRRQFFDDIFSGTGGVNTRANLLTLWKRSALLIEKVFATGTGTDASPASLVWEGTISYPDVQAARES